VAVVVHGAYSTAALAPRVTSMRRSLLARMQLKQRDLTWAGRELLDSYVRAKAKVVAIDEWLESNPMIRADGTTAPVMKVYFVALNASVRTLDALRGVIRDMDRGAGDFARALEALEAER
jgi:hypothetical protein